MMGRTGIAIVAFTVLMAACGSDSAIPAPSTTSSASVTTTTATRSSQVCDADTLLRVAAASGFVGSGFTPQASDVHCVERWASAVISSKEDPGVAAAAYFEFDGTTWRLLSLGNGLDRPPP